MRRHQYGYSAIELLVVVAIIGTIVTAAVPSFFNLQRSAALRAASAEIRSIFHLARSRAIARGTNCGLKFVRLGGEWHFAIYDDGDRDGVRNDDIRRGVDRLVSPPRIVFPPSRAVTIGLLAETVRDPDGKRLPPSRSPVHFNRSAICSFSPLGSSTPGTIYLTDRNGGLYAVRVYGTTAKIRVLRYERKTRRWV